MMNTQDTFASSKSYVNTSSNKFKKAFNEVTVKASTLPDTKFNNSKSTNFYDQNNKENSFGSVDISG